MQVRAAPPSHRKSTSSTFFVWSPRKQGLKEVFRVMRNLQEKIWKTLPYFSDSSYEPLLTSNPEPQTRHRYVDLVWSRFRRTTSFFGCGSWHFESPVLKSLWHRKQCSLSGSWPSIHALSSEECKSTRFFGTGYYWVRKLFDLTN